MNKDYQCEVKKYTLPHHGKDEVTISVGYDKTGCLLQFTLNQKMMSENNIEQIITSMVKSVYKRVRNEK